MLDHVRYHPALCEPTGRGRADAAGRLLTQGVVCSPEALEAKYYEPGWAVSKARRFYQEEWERMDCGTGDQRPPYPYTEIIKMAMLKSPHRRLTLCQLYADCSSKFPYFANLGTTDSWKNTLRHNLSTQRYFIKLNREVSQPGKGHYWTYDANIELACMSSRRKRQLGVSHYVSPSIQSRDRFSPVNSPLRPRTEPRTPEARSVHLLHSPERADAEPVLLRRMSCHGALQQLSHTRIHSPVGSPHDMHKASGLGRDNAGHGRALSLPTMNWLPRQDGSGPRRSLSDHFLAHPIAPRKPTGPLFWP